MNGNSLNRENTVYLYRLENNGDPSTEEFVKGAYELLRAFLPNPGTKNRIVIKPNVTIPARPESGIVTHPAFVGGIVEYFKEIGAKEILVAEGVGRDNQHWDVADYLTLAKEKGVKLVSLSTDERVQVPIPNSVMFDKVTLARTVKEPDVFLVNVPKMKTHNLGITTLCMKNLMGTIIPPERHLCGRASEFSKARTGSPTEAYEECFSEELSDLSSAIKPDLNIVEGIVGRDGTAFHRGRNYNSRIAVAGTNVVAVDTVTSYLMGFNPAEIHYLKAAAKRGLGTNKISDLRIYEAVDSQLKLIENIDDFSLDNFQVIHWSGKNIPRLYKQVPTEWKYPETSH